MITIKVKITIKMMNGKVVIVKYIMIMMIMLMKEGVQKVV